MNGSKGNILVIMAIFALLLVFGGQALAQGMDTPTSITPPTSTETGNSSWLQRMQEWMGPAARGQMIQNMTQVHGAAATGQMLQHMSQDDDCSGSEECVSAGMGGVFNGRGSVMDEGMMGGRD